MHNPKVYGAVCYNVGVVGWIFVLDGHAAECVWVDKVDRGRVST
jgi:hypothetical protein